MADSKKYNGSTWKHSLRKQTTASEIIIPPTTIYCDGSIITTYSIKGNTVQNGTGTPDSPVTPEGCGDLEATGEHVGQYKISISSGGVTTNIYLGNTQTTRQIKKLVFTGGESWSKNTGSSNNYLYYIPYSSILPLAVEKTDIICTHFIEQRYPPVDAIGINTKNNYNQLYVNFGEILNSQPLGNTPAGVKQFLAAQYAAGTPVTIWYVLATPESAIVNEPLMKIGNYADTLSNAAQIPTVQGANRISVDTTVQPSEFTATWTGWHNATVKEWDGQNWT